MKIPNYIQNHGHSLGNYFIYFVHFICIAAFLYKNWDFIKQTISSIDTSPSQKRFVVFLYTLLIIDITLMVVILKFVVSDTMYYSLGSLVAFGIGATAWEKAKLNSNQQAAPAQTNE